MTKSNYTPKRKKFHHLTKEKRAQLEILLKIIPKVPKIKIATMLGIARSTLYEELKRGTVEQIDTNLKSYTKYYADVGQRVYMQQRKNSRNPLKLIWAIEFIRYAEEQILKNKLSPDAVYGYVRVNNLYDKMVCTITLINV